MATKEEIREGIDTSIQFAITAAYLAGKTGEDLEETKEKCTTYLKDALHSQGVVIRIDGELPENKSFKDEQDDELTMMYGFAQQDMLEAGYVAVESLIDDN